MGCAWQLQEVLHEGLERLSPAVNKKVAESPHAALQTVTRKIVYKHQIEKALLKVRLSVLPCPMASTAAAATVRRRERSVYYPSRI